GEARGLCPVAHHRLDIGRQIALPHDPGDQPGNSRWRIIAEMEFHALSGGMFGRRDSRRAVVNAAVAVNRRRCDRQAMRPGRYFPLQVNSRRLQPALPGVAAWLALSFAYAQPAIAQDSGPDDPAPTALPADPAADREIAFEADELAYEQDSDTVTASGDVLLRS